MNQVYEIDEAELIDAFLETEYQKLLGLRTALLHADDRPLPLLDVQLRQIRVLSYHLCNNTFSSGFVSFVDKLTEDEI